MRLGGRRRSRAPRGCDSIHTARVRAVTAPTAVIPYHRDTGRPSEAATPAGHARGVVEFTVAGCGQAQRRRTRFRKIRATPHRGAEDGPPRWELFGRTAAG